MSVMNSKKTKKKYRYVKRKNVRTMKRIRNIRKKKRKKKRNKKTRKKKKIKGGFVDLPTGLSSLMYPGAVGSLYVFFLSMISNKPELIKKLKKAASKIGSKNLVDAINNSDKERKVVVSEEDVMKAVEKAVEEAAEEAVKKAAA